MGRKLLENGGEIFTLLQIFNQGQIGKNTLK